MLHFRTVGIIQRIVVRFYVADVARLQILPRKPELLRVQLRIAATFGAIALLVCLLPNSASAVEGSAIEGSGISARFEPPQVRPGDVCALMVEMDRDTFGQFELHVPAHSQLHLVSVERVPVALVNGRYRQRQSLQLQPLSSGEMAINEAQVQLTDTNGTQTILLPVVTLQVLPFETADVSDAPESLPGTIDGRAATSLAIGYGVAIVIGVLLIAVAIFCKLRLRTSNSEAHQILDPALDAVEELQSGTVPKHSLEQLLGQRGSTLSPELRCEIEEAVYGERCQPAALLALLRKELVP